MWFFIFIKEWIFGNSYIFGLNPQLNYHFIEGDGLCSVILTPSIRFLHRVHLQWCFGNWCIFEKSWWYILLEWHYRNMNCQNIRSLGITIWCPWFSSYHWPKNQGYPSLPWLTSAWLRTSPNLLPCPGAHLPQSFPWLLGAHLIPASANLHMSCSLNPKSLLKCALYLLPWSQTCLSPENTASSATPSLPTLISQTSDW